MNTDHRDTLTDARTPIAGCVKHLKVVFDNFSLYFLKMETWTAHKHANALVIFPLAIEIPFFVLALAWGLTTNRKLWGKTQGLGSN